MFSSSDQPSHQAEQPSHQPDQLSPTTEAELAAIRHLLQTSNLLLLAWTIDLGRIERRLYGVQRALVAASDYARERAQAARLTWREREVLALMARGLTNKQIAEELGILPGTVINHVGNISSKLDVHSRYEAVHRAEMLGFI